MKTLFTLLVLAVGAAHAQTQVDQLGVITLSMPKIIGRTVTVPFEAPRPGMYDVSVRIGQLYVGQDPNPVTFSLNGVPARPAEPREGFRAIGRGYIAKKGPNTLVLAGPAANDVVGITLYPAPEGRPIAQAGAGPITLMAQDATVWGTLLRFEPEPHKRCIGYWAKPADFATWDFTVETPGTYTVTIDQGCGKGEGGSRATVSCGPQVLPFVVEDTGGFQNWLSKELGEFTFEKPGVYRVEARAVTKPGVAVMDIQKITLEPKKEG